MSYNPQNPNGQATSADSAPVVIASDQSAIDVTVAGVSTAAKQDTGNTSLAAIDTNAGATTDASVAAGATGSISAKLRRVTTDLDSVKTSVSSIDGKTPSLGQATMANSVPVAIASNQGSLTVTSTVSGDVASGSADSGNPVKVGGIAKTSLPTAVTDGQRVNQLMSKTGKAVAIGALREQLGSQKTTITSSTAETTIVTADATYFLDLYGLVIANTSASNCKVTIKDSTSGTTRFIIQVPAADTRGFMLPVDSAHKQATANNNWTATCGSSVADIEITAMYVKNL